MALTSDGSLYAFGCGSDGRLGFEEAKSYRFLFKEEEPRKIEGIQAIDVCCAYYANIALILA